MIEDVPFESATPTILDKDSNSTESILSGPGPLDSQSKLFSSSLKAALKAKAKSKLNSNSKTSLPLNGIPSSLGQNGEEEEVDEENQDKKVVQDQSNEPLTESQLQERKEKKKLKRKAENKAFKDGKVIGSLCLILLEISSLYLTFSISLCLSLSFYASPDLFNSLTFN